MIVSIRYTEYLILIQGMREMKNKLFKIFVISRKIVLQILSIVNLTLPS